MKEGKRSRKEDRSDKPKPDLEAESSEMAAGVGG